MSVREASPESPDGEGSALTASIDDGSVHRQTSADLKPVPRGLAPP